MRSLIILRLAILLCLVVTTAAHAQGVKFKQGITRQIIAGTSDVAKTSDYWGFIAWKSPNAGTKTETLPPCTLTSNGVWIGISDEQNSAATYNINVAAQTGTVGGAVAGVTINSNLGSVVVSCDGAATNWVVSSQFAPGSNVRNVTATSDVILPTDNGGLVTYNSGSPVAVSLAQVSTVGFPSNSFAFLARNYGAGVVTVTPTISTINNGASTLAISQGQSAIIFSSGAGNYDVVLIGTAVLPTIANGHIIGNATGSTGTAADTNLLAGAGISLLATGGAITITNTGTGSGGSGAQVPLGPNIWSISFAPGPIAALPATSVASGFVKVPISSTINNIMLSTLVAGTCSVVPTISLRKCGTSLTCAASTDRGSAQVSNTAGTAIDVAVTDSAVVQGDYLAWQFSAGTCSAPPDIQATATLWSNPGYCAAASQMAFTTYCNSAMQSLI